jgi:hypothetical protein
MIRIEGISQLRIDVNSAPWRQGCRSLPAPMFPLRSRGPGEPNLPRSLPPARPADSIEHPPRRDEGIQKRIGDIFVLSRK